MAVQDSTIRLTIVTKRVKGYLSSTFTGTSKHATVNRLKNYITSIYSGSESPYDSSNPCSIALNIKGNATAASGSVAFSNTSSANDTVLVNGVTFTAVASGATGNQWNIGASATASAANLSTTINASTTAMVTGIVTSSASVGTLTFSSIDFGIFGNTTTIAKGVDAGSVMTVSGARLTGGAVDPGAVTLNF